MIVTLCGSARFEDHFKTWNEALTMAGHTVFTLTRYPSEKGAKLWYTDAQKLALDEAHKRKINASEAVLVLNVFGYMGPSTLSEVEHARSRGKKLYALESWGKGNGICSMHYDHVQEALKRMIPEGYVGSPIATTSPTFRYAYDLFDGLSYAERWPLVELVKGADDRAYDADGVPEVEAPERCIVCGSETCAGHPFPDGVKTVDGGQR